MWGRTCKKVQKQGEDESTLPNMAKKKDKEDYTISVAKLVQQM